MCGHGIESFLLITTKTKLLVMLDAVRKLFHFFVYSNTMSFENIPEITERKKIFEHDFEGEFQPVKAVFYDISGQMEQYKIDLRKYDPEKDYSDLMKCVETIVGKEKLKEQIFTHCKGALFYPFKKRFWAFLNGKKQSLLHLLDLKMSGPLLITSLHNYYWYESPQKTLLFLGHNNPNFSKIIEKMFHDYINDNNINLDDLTLSEKSYRKKIMDLSYTEPAPITKSRLELNYDTEYVYSLPAFQPQTVGTELIQAIVFDLINKREICVTDPAWGTQLIPYGYSFPIHSLAEGILLSDQKIYIELLPTNET